MPLQCSNLTLVNFAVKVPSGALTNTQPPMAALFEVKLVFETFNSAVMLATKNKPAPLLRLADCPTSFEFRISTSAFWE